MNVVALYKWLVEIAMRLGGMSSQLVQIDSNTVLNFWGPKKPNSTKPTIVFLHGFISNAIFTWQFQVWSLKSHYNVYAPDLLFFGDSFTTSDQRTIKFQAHCVASGLKKLGVEKCVVVGFSYGGMVGFKLAEIYPELVESLVVNGSCIEMTKPLSVDCLTRIGMDSWEFFLLPETVNDLKMTLGIGAHRFPWFPSLFYQHFLEVECQHMKERAELLKAMVTIDEFSIPNFPQKIHLLWGENDRIFNMEIVQSMLRQLNLDATRMHLVEKAGHIALIESPRKFNLRLRNVLKSLKVPKNPDMHPEYPLALNSNSNPNDFL